MTNNILLQAAILYSYIVNHHVMQFSVTSYLIVDNIWSVIIWGPCHSEMAASLLFP